MKLSKAFFTYPGNTTPTLHNITIQVSMAFCISVVSVKQYKRYATFIQLLSTMIKVLTGELVPQEGEVWMHPNARVAYVAQHAFHHIKAHLDKTPNEYIRWHYEGGQDGSSRQGLHGLYSWRKLPKDSI